MKQSKYLLFVLFFISSLYAAANTHTSNPSAKEAVSSKIISYLSTIDYSYDLESVTIFSDFLVNEKGYLYNVDFMINEKGELLILSKEEEKEYYKVNSYSTIHLVQHTFPVANVIAEK